MRLTVGRSLSIALLLFTFLLVAAAALALLRVDRRVSVPGEFAYRSVAPVVCEESGFVVTVVVREGADLAAGAPILALANDDLEAEARRAETRVAIVELEARRILENKGFSASAGALDVSRLDEELRYKRDRLASLARDTDHAKDLFEKQLGSRKSYDDAALAWKGASAEVGQLEIEVARVRGRLEELDASTRLEYELRLRELAIERDLLAQLSRRRQRLTIRAPATGRLVAEDLSRLAGTYLERGTHVGDVVSYEDIDFVGHASGTDVVRVRTGQRVYFNVELFRRRKFVTGRVVRVGDRPLGADRSAAGDRSSAADRSSATDRSGGFPVEVAVDDRRFFDRGRLLHIQAGVPAEAIIITEEGISLARLLWEKAANTLDFD